MIRDTSCGSSTGTIVANEGIQGNTLKSQLRQTVAMYKDYVYFNVTYSVNNGKITFTVQY